VRGDFHCNRLFFSLFQLSQYVLDGQGVGRRVKGFAEFAPLALTKRPDNAAVIHKLT
jgi:hypothetical protein